MLLALNEFALRKLLVVQVLLLLLLLPLLFLLPGVWGRCMRKQHQPAASVLTAAVVGAATAGVASWRVFSGVREGRMLTPQRRARGPLYRLLSLHGSLSYFTCCYSGPLAAAAAFTAVLGHLLTRLCCFFVGCSCRMLTTPSTSSCCCCCRLGTATVVPRILLPLLLDVLVPAAAAAPATFALLLLLLLLLFDEPCQGGQRSRRCAHAVLLKKRLLSQFQLPFSPFTSCCCCYFISLSGGGVAATATSRGA